MPKQRSLARLATLAYVTDLDDQCGGGGSYAVNWHIQDQLGKHFELVAPGPIVPRVSAWQKAVSRVQRYVLKRPSRFFYFSPRVLDENAERVSRSFGLHIDGIFFRSATRWCHCTPPAPYFVYLDVVFHTFFENTFDPRHFLQSDLERIFQSEARFLEGAAAVFFESDWGLQKAKAAYALKGDHYVAAHRGGAMNTPLEDRWSGESLILLSVALKFEQKGGDIILEAFKQLKKRHPELRWHIVGGAPLGDWQSVEGIVYEGKLDLDFEPDVARYRNLLANAFLLLHPTREDTNPLVLTEAAYFGCPSVSVNRFAIPELVIDGKTGVLLDWPALPGDLADAVHGLIESPDRYRQMRRAAFEYSRAEFDWGRIGDRIAQRISLSLA